MSLSKIKSRYNPENDTPQNEPQVSWVEMALLDEIEVMRCRILQLEEQVAKVDEKLSKLQFTMVTQLPSTNKRPGG